MTSSVPDERKLELMIGRLPEAVSCQGLAYRSSPLHAENPDDLRRQTAVCSAQTLGGVVTSSVPDEVQRRDKHRIEMIGNDREGYRARCSCEEWQDRDGCKRCLEALADRHIRAAS